VQSLVIIQTGTPGSGLFLYNGTPGPGTLLASVTESSTDPFGNTTQPGGFVIYDGQAYIDVHVNTTIGAPAIEMITGAGSEAEHAAIYTQVNNPFAVTESMTTVLLGPGSTADNIQPFVQLQSAPKNALSNADGILGLFTSGVASTVAFWDKTGFQAASPGGVTGWYANGTQTDATSHPQTNIVSASFGNVTAAWTIQANDVNVGTIYEVEMPFTGVHEGIQLNIGINFAGTFTNVVPVLASWTTTGHSYVGTVRLKLTFTAKGAGGAANIDIDGTMTDSGANRGPATSVTLNGHTSLSIDTTAAHAFAVAVQWASSNASQSLTGLGSVYRRNGQ
jgi:hypothetical protein